MQGTPRERVPSTSTFRNKLAIEHIRMTGMRTTARRLLSILVGFLIAANIAHAKPHGGGKESDSVQLSSQEQRYLTRKGIIKVCVDPDWMPYEQILNGKHVGISKDYMDLFMSMIKTPIVLVPTTSWDQSLQYVRLRKCDLLPLAVKVPERERFLSFTDAYMRAPMVIATDYRELYIQDLGDAIENKKIGLVKGYAMISILKKEYPKNHIVEVPSAREGLAMVDRGELYGMIDFLPTLGYLIQSDYIGKLKISAKFHDTLDLRVAVRNDSPELLSIFSKLIASIMGNPHNQFMAIERKWTAIVVEKNPNYGLFYIAIGVITAVTMLLSIRHFYLVKLNRTLHLQSRTDLLTNLKNRRAFYENAKEIMVACKKQGIPAGLALIDIDQFKGINDRHGHDIGDAVIRFVADRLQENTRNTDVIARMGGEEFAIILPHADRDNSFKVARTLQEKIAASPIPIKDLGDLKVTVSIGVSAVSSQDTDIDQGLKRADQALYEAKNTGRNRVVLSNVS